MASLLGATIYTVAYNANQRPLKNGHRWTPLDLERAEVLSMENANFAAVEEHYERSIKVNQLALRKLNLAQLKSCFPVLVQ